MKKKKKVLIISYYWPPAGGIGVLRILKFTKYLRHYGWEPIVHVPKNADYPYTDNNNFKDIPQNLTVLRTRIVEPFKLFKLLSGRKKTDSHNPIYGDNKKRNIVDELAIWIRGNFFIPDARACWIKPSVIKLSKYLKEHPVDAILSDGPPHTNTMIAQKLSEKFNIPWLADFQDPWTQVDYYKLLKLTKWADKRHKAMEQSVFRTAAKITIASPTWAKDLEKIGAKNVSVIYYGYDEDDFVNLKSNNNSDNFIISHTGILGNDRNPEILFKALSDIVSENETFRNKLKIIFAGTVDESVRTVIKENNLEHFYQETGNISRHEALQLSNNSNILLLPINKADNAKGRLPGKLYEYLRIGKPILCLGPVDSDASEIIAKTNSGKTFEYDDYKNIKSYILGIFENKIKFKPKNIEQYSNLTQTGLIAKYLDEITTK